MRDEEHDGRWKARWPKIELQEGKEKIIHEADGRTLLHILTAMNLLHMNDATRAMLRDRYPKVYERAILAQYDDAEKRLVTLLKAAKL